MASIVTFHKDVVGTGYLVIGQHFENIKSKVSARARKSKICGFPNEAAGCASFSFLLEPSKEINFKCLCNIEREQS